MSEGSRADVERLIERGNFALHVISSAARAARAEARKAELEVALAEAQRGNAALLRNWLASNQAGESPPLASQQPGDPKTKTDLLGTDAGGGTPVRPLDSASALAAASGSVEVQPTSHAAPAPGWSGLVPHARGRLETVANRLQSEVAPQSEAASAATGDGAAGEDSHSADPICADSETAVADTAAQLGTADGIEEWESASLRDHEAALLLDEFESTGANSSDDAPLEFEDTPELQMLAEATREPGKSMFRGGARGLTVSVAVHLVLLVALTAITLKLPDVPMGLGFDSSSNEADLEALDDSEPMEPMEVTSPDILPEMPSDASFASSVSLSATSALKAPSGSVSAPAAASALSRIGASANPAASPAGSGRPNLSKASANFFGAGAAGTSFCYVLDGSESMRGGPWDAAKAELLRSLSTLKENHRFYIIFFNQELSAIPLPGQRAPATSLLYATAENLQHAQNWIESLRIARGAPPNDALEHAIEIEPDAIYLLADGVTKLDVPEFLRGVNRTHDFVNGEQVRVPIHTIAFYSPDDGRKLMQQVAAENKGQFIYVPDPRQR